MGIPSSPHFGSAWTGREFVGSKHQSPELPLLEEAASELACLDELQLLPASVVELKRTDSTPTTAIPASPHVEDFDDSGEEAAEWTPVTARDEAGRAEQGAQPRAGARAALAPIDMPAPVAEGLCAMWCRMEAAAAGTLVTPVADASGGDNPPPSLAEALGCVVKLWCWVQRDSEGALMVVPCTGKGLGASPDLAEASGRSDAESACAPLAPPCGSYEPEWKSGPYWPFNAAPTTLCATGLPDSITQEDLVEVLDREEFSGFYDFVFLPAAPEQGQSQRKALINFTRHEYAVAFASRLQGRTSWGAAGRGDCCQVDWSMPLQGLDALVQVHCGARRGAEEQPALFADGWPRPSC